MHAKYYECVFVNAKNWKSQHWKSRIYSNWPGFEINRQLLNSKVSQHYVAQC